MKTDLVLILVVAYLLAVRLVSVTILPHVPVPKDPPASPFSRFSFKDELKIGSKLSRNLALVPCPGVYIVHTECLSCSSEAGGQAKALLDRRDVYNLVLSMGQDAYRDLADGSPTVLFGPPAWAKSLNVMFSPRVYGFSRGAVVAFVQPAGMRLEEAIREARTAVH